MNLLIDKVIKGIGWSLVSRVGRQSVQVLLSILLARLLKPEDFGLLGMITVFIGFANVFLDMGFGSALIQKKEVEKDHYNSIFWINLIAGITLAFIFFIASPFIANFYGEPTLNQLTKFISLSFIIGSLGIVQTSILKKSLLFKRLAIVEVGALILSGILGIISALIGLGVWSLAIQTVSLSFFTVIILWFINDWRPAFSFKRSYVKDLLGFSSNLLGFNSFNYWIRNIDNLLVGKILGTAALGIYSNAYRILLAPIYLISYTIGQVLFPAFSTIQENKEEIARLYLKMTGVIALITFPMMTLLFVLSDHFVLGLFGENWIEMIPILRVFSIVGILQSIGTINGNLYLSEGRTELQFKVGLVVGLLGISAIVIGLRWGIIGIAIAYGIATTILFYPTLNIAVSLVGLKAMDVLKNFLGIIVCTIIMGLLIWIFDQLFPDQWAHIISLIALSFIGSIIYFVLIHIFKVNQYKSVINILIQQFRLLRRSGDSISIN
jgi:PST family polysaccharide transporter